MADILVFGYGSLMCARSAKSSFHGIFRDFERIPARLHGFRRTWGAIHHDTKVPRKRYVTLPDFEVVEHYAFANIVPADQADTVGVCYRVSEDQLAALDHRERGYIREDVSGKVTFWDDISPAARVFAYRDPNEQTPTFPLPIINPGYVNLMTDSAAAINEQYEGYLAAFLETTTTPSARMEGISQLFFDPSGTDLFLLHSADSSVVWIHSFSRPQMAPSYANNAPHPSERAITQDRLAYDRRYRTANSVTGASMWSDFMGLSDRPFRKGRDLIGLDDSTHWLVRMAVADHPFTPENVIRDLLDDIDHWVRRTAYRKMRKHDEN